MMRNGSWGTRGWGRWSGVRLTLILCLFSSSLAGSGYLRIDVRTYEPTIAISMYEESTGMPQLQHAQINMAKKNTKK